MVYCNLCGEKLGEDGKCPNNHVFKKMCLNCACLGSTENDGESGKAALVCLSEENKKEAMEKMLTILKENGGGYSVKNLEIEPVPLKKPELKCKRWSLSEAAREEVLNLFV